MSQQGRRQASIRAVTGSAETYEGDWHRLFDMAGIRQEHFNGRLLLWINAQLSSSYTNLPEAQQAYATSIGIYDWGSIGTFTPGGAAQTQRQVATRSYVNNCYSTTSLYARSQSVHYNRSGVSQASLKLCYFNVARSMTSGGPVGTGTEVNLDACVVMAGIEYPVGSGNWTRVLWSGGLTSYAAAAGEVAYSDLTPLLVAVPDGGQFAVRWYVVSTGNIGYVNANTGGGGTNALRMSGDVAQMSATILTDTSMGGTITAGAAFFMPPAAIIGLSTTGAALLVGDSIGQGTADDATTATYGDTGLLARSIGPTRPYINGCDAGERCYQFVDNNTKLLGLLQWCQAAVSNFGVNDFNVAARTIAQIETALSAAWTDLAAVPVYQTTITPVSGTANAFNRVAVNDWIRTIPTGLAGFFEVATVTETFRNSSVQKTTPSTWFADSAHLTPYGYGQVASSGAIVPFVSAPVDIVTLPTGTNFVLDSFTDTNGVAITSHTGELGATWALQSSYAPASPDAISSNRLYCPTTTGVYVASGTPQSADYFVEGVLNKVSVSTAGGGFIGRAAAAVKDMYYASWNGSTNAWNLNVTIAGTSTLLGTAITDTIAVSAPRTVRLIMAGSRISLAVDGIEIIVATDAQLTAAGQGGVRNGTAVTSSTGTHTDNFRAAA